MTKKLLAKFAWEETGAFIKIYAPNKKGICRTMTDTTKNGSRHVKDVHNDVLRVSNDHWFTCSLYRCANYLTIVKPFLGAST